jgi:hypothetical protein
MLKETKEIFKKCFTTQNSFIRYDKCNLNCFNKNDSLFCISTLFNKFNFEKCNNIVGTPFQGKLYCCLENRLLKLTHQIYLQNSVSVFLYIKTLDGPIKVVF